MRKFFFTFVCAAGLTGVALAAEVTLVKYDAKTKEVTVKEGDAW